MQLHRFCVSVDGCAPTKQCIQRSGRLTGDDGGYANALPAPEPRPAARVRVPWRALFAAHWLAGRRLGPMEISTAPTRERKKEEQKSPGYEKSFCRRRSPFSLSLVCAQTERRPPLAAVAGQFKINFQRRLRRFISSFRFVAHFVFLELDERRDAFEGEGEREGEREPRVYLWREHRSD